MDSTRRPVFRAALLLSGVAVTFCAAQQPVVVRLRDAVGDTIDAAERDSFRLFPNTAGFQHAVILALPGPEFFAKVTLAGTDTTTQVYLRIMPMELERIRFLVDNREYMAGQVRSDSNAALALASFWLEVEERPLRSIAGESADVQNVARAPTEAPAAGESQLQPVTSEYRYNGALHGATVGSVAGGCLGSQVAVSVSRYRPGGGCGEPNLIPVYRLNHTLLFATTLGVTALGAAAGYANGAKQDREPPFQPVYEEGKGWRTGLAIGSVVPGLCIGFATAFYAAGTVFGRLGPDQEFENDPHSLRLIPAGLTGLCVSVELVTAAYLIGREIDRHRAVQDGRKRESAGR